MGPAVFHSCDPRGGPGGLPPCVSSQGAPPFLSPALACMHCACLRARVAVTSVVFLCVIFTVSSCAVDDWQHLSLVGGSLAGSFKVNGTRMGVSRLSLGDCCRIVELCAFFAVPLYVQPTGMGGEE
jgi:hypothetical protein